MQEVILKSVKYVLCAVVLILNLLCQCVHKWIVWLCD